MSGKETKLDDLNVELSKEEEDIVDSIISELNEDESKPPPPQQRPPSQQRPPPQQRPPQQMSSQQMPPQQMPPQQMPPQQMQMPPNMDPNIMQQRMMQQQMMQQQMMKRMAEEEKKEEKKEELSFMDKLKIDMKEPATVVFITLLMLLPQTNSLITSTKLSFLLNADGSINLYGLMIKAILAGVLFFLAQKYT